MTENILLWACTPGYWGRIPDLSFLTSRCFKLVRALLPSLAILRQAKRSPRASSPAITRASQIKYSWLQGETKTIKLHRFENSPLKYFRSTLLPNYLPFSRAGWSCYTARQGPVPHPRGQRQPQALSRDRPDLGELKDSALYSDTAQTSPF